MTITGPDARPGASGQAVVDAAMLVLERMGLTPADLLATPVTRPTAPTFAEYVPVVSAAVINDAYRIALLWRDQLYVLTETSDAAHEQQGQ
jgi:hypothetical protein